ncbi:MAG TPA: thioredoxin domain-containing protein [Propionibacteriaceae bacterium]
MSKSTSAVNADRRKLAREAQLREAAAAKRRRTLIQIAVVGTVAVVVIGIVTTAVIIGSRQRSQTTPSANATVTVGTRQVPFAIDGSAVRVGPADAKAKVDLWVDYSCPHCQEFEATNSEALNSLIAGGDVSVSYHNIQVDTDYALEAGSAAACVATHDPNAWVGFNATLYANHSETTDGWTSSQFKDFAAQQGVNAEAQTCISSGRYTGWITSNTADAAKNDVSGTPTMFLNGVKSETLSGQALVAKVNELAGR